MSRWWFSLLLVVIAFGTGVMLSTRSAYLPNQPPVSSAPTETISPIANTTSTNTLARGALVSRVASTSPATVAGIQTGDVITSFAGVEIYNRDELLQRLVLQKPGDVVPIVLSRNGQSLSVSLRLGESLAP